MPTNSTFRSNTMDYLDVVKVAQHASKQRICRQQKESCRLLASIPYQRSSPQLTPVVFNSTTQDLQIKTKSGRVVGLAARQAIPMSALPKGTMELRSLVHGAVSGFLFVGGEPSGLHASVGGAFRAKLYTNGIAIQMNSMAHGA